MIDGDWEMVDESVAFGFDDMKVRIGDRGGLVDGAGGRVGLGSGVATDSVYHSCTYAS